MNNNAQQRGNNVIASDQKSKGSKSQRTKSKRNKRRNRTRGDNNLAVSGQVSRRETAPAAQSRFRSTGSPKQRFLKNGDIEVTHTEFIADIPGSQAFAVTGYPVNPGMPSTFPWLSQMAPLYESYMFEELRFEYQNTCGSQTPGLAMLAIDYDASDPAPSNKQQMAAYQGYARDAVWKDFDHRSTQKNLSKRKSYYVRNGILAANQDIKLYDTGNLFSGTFGQATDGDFVGELYVHYRVRLMTPQLQNPGVGQSRSYRLTANTTGTTVTSGSDAPLVASGNTTSGVILTASGAYNGLVAIQMSSTSGSPVPDTSTSTCTVQSSNSVISGVNCSFICEIAMQPGQTFVMTQGANPAGQTIRIGQYNTTAL